MVVSFFKNVPWIHEWLFMLILSNIRINESMKTVPPDEIIAILDQGKYNKHHLPTQFGGPPTEVLINVYIEGMSSFRAQSMDFQVDIYLSERWHDPRLQHTGLSPSLLRDWSVFERLWHPDLYFANAKDAKFHTVTAQNFGMYIWPNGSIYLDIRVSLVVNCMMDLSHFPLDSQECFIRILSYAYDRDHLSLSWLPEDNITRNPDILLPDMDLVSLSADYCNGVYVIGNWSCARARFRMRREVMHHVLQSYLPTALIVVISWFSFWLDADSVAARVSLCITTLLTLATQAQAAKMSLPQVSYAKAIDVWMGVCMAFVFGVMIEFTAVNYISRRAPGKDTVKAVAKKRRESYLMRVGLVGMAMSAHKESIDHRKSVQPRHRDTGSTLTGERANSTDHPGHFHQNGQAPTDHSEPTEAAETLTLTPEEKEQKVRNHRFATGVDRISRYIFPVTFLLFNAIYWSYYLRDRDHVTASLL